ncbi:response regulator transcription factor [Streptomyces sp. SP18CS02]|uniref:response regulator transcription factor n=1 Tax=Streptomyces sp. SP18CS02 TaxID=3002531 RepID=UPI002E768317|nr:response regulator transcription factor [Streptomyces sp. SP18CS02]MEE1756291.1 response regulator transcription factor [Streptomyces sp. SP18CS02]
MPDNRRPPAGQHVSQHTSAHPTPLSSTPRTPTAPGDLPPLPPAPPSPVLRVVVADDNPVVRAGLSALLSGRADIEVAAEAADGRQAYEETLRHRPDVVLLDVRMPGVDGISALPHLARLAPVLMMTYSRESEIVHEALRLGAGGYLVHGEFTADQLVEAVRDVKQGRAHFTHTASSALLASLRGRDAGPGGLPDGLGTAFPYASATAYIPVERCGPSSASPVEAGVDEGRSPAQRFAQTPSLPQAGVAHSLLSQREVEVMDLIASGMSNQQIAATCFISPKTVKNHINRIFAKLNAESRGQAIAIWHGLSRGGPVRHG